MKGIENVKDMLISMGIGAAVFVIALTAVVALSGCAYLKRTAATAEVAVPGVGNVRVGGYPRTGFENVNKWVKACVEKHDDDYDYREAVEDGKIVANCACWEEGVAQGAIAAVHQQAFCAQRPTIIVPQTVPACPPTTEQRRCPEPRERYCDPSMVECLQRSGWVCDYAITKEGQWCSKPAELGFDGS